LVRAEHVSITPWLFSGSHGGEGAAVGVVANSPLRWGRHSLEKNGGRYWTRTSDPCDVNTVLYQLS
jgi:hypothetical protein